MSLSLCHLTSWRTATINRKTSIIYQQKYMQTLCQTKFLGPFWQGATSILNYPFWSKPWMKDNSPFDLSDSCKLHSDSCHPFTQTVTLSEWSNLFCMSILGAYHKSPPAKQFRGLVCSTGWSRMILGFLLCLKTANIAFQAIWNFGTWCFLGPDTRPVGLKENTISISINQGTENNHSPWQKSHHTNHSSRPLHIPKLYWCRFRKNIQVNNL